MPGTWCPGPQRAQVAAALSMHRDRSTSTCVISSAWRSILERSQTQQAKAGHL